MKQTLLLLAAACMGSQAFAQTQSAFVDAVALLGEDAAKTAVAVKSGTIVAQSDNVTMTAAWDDTYKIVSLTAEGDTYNNLVIDGVAYSCPKGIQGQNNPDNNNLTKSSSTNAVFRFDVTADGYLYVFSKISYNKNYYVWEGETVNVNKAFTNIVAYNLTGYSSDGTLSTYTLPALPVEPDGGYFSADGGAKLAEGADAYLATSWKRTYVKFSDVDASLIPEGKKASDKITWTIYNESADIKAAVDAKYPEIPEQVGGYKDGDNIVLEATNAGQTLAQASDCAVAYGSNKFSGNILGVIAFPVYKEFTYYVNATGSKITCDGFVFIPGAEKIATISGSKSNAIKNITVDDLDADAPVYNLLGQKVKSGYKGVCIQNGKKFVVK